MLIKTAHITVPLLLVVIIFAVKADFAFAQTPTTKPVQSSTKGDQDFYDPLEGRTVNKIRMIRDLRRNDGPVTTPIQTRKPQPTASSSQPFSPPKLKPTPKPSIKSKPTIYKPAPTVYKPPPQKSKTLANKTISTGKQNKPSLPPIPSIGNIPSPDRIAKAPPRQPSIKSAPRISPMPKPAPKVASMPKPAPRISPMPKPAPKVASMPKPAPRISPMPKPAPRVASMPKPAPRISPMPKPAPKVASMPKPAPRISPMPKPAPKVASMPKPAPRISPMPKPAPRVASMPKPAPRISPMPKHAPKTSIGPLPSVDSISGIAKSPVPISKPSDVFKAPPSTVPHPLHPVAKTASKPLPKDESLIPAPKPLPIAKTAPRPSHAPHSAGPRIPPSRPLPVVKMPSIETEKKPIELAQADSHKIEDLEPQKPNEYDQELKRLSDKNEFTNTGMTMLAKTQDSQGETLEELREQIDEQNKLIATIADKKSIPSSAFPPLRKNEKTTPADKLAITAKKPESGLSVDDNYLTGLLEDMITNPSTYILWSGYLPEAGPVPIRYSAYQPTFNRRNLIPLSTPYDEDYDTDSGLLTIKTNIDTNLNEGPEKTVPVPYSLIKELTAADIANRLGNASPAANEVEVEFSLPYTANPTGLKGPGTISQ